MNKRIFYLLLTAGTLSALLGYLFTDVSASKSISSLEVPSLASPMEVTNNWQTIIASTGQFQKQAPPEEDNTSVIKAGSLEAIQITGVVLDSASRIYFIDLSDMSSHSMKVGDTWHKWKLNQISQTHIQLVNNNNGDNAMLPLYQFKPE